MDIASVTFITISAGILLSSVCTSISVAYLISCCLNMKSKPEGHSLGHDGAYRSIDTVMLILPALT